MVVPVVATHQPVPAHRLIHEPQRGRPYRHRKERVEPPLTIVTGSSSNHFKPLVCFLQSWRIYEPYSRAVIWDLGLTKDEMDYLKRNHPHAVYKRFPFDVHPSYFDIQVNAGCYAWKPVLIYETAKEFKGLILWCDAGNLLKQHLRHIRYILDEKYFGVYTPNSPGTIQRWTHFKTLKKLNVKSEFLDHRCRMGGLVGLNWDSYMAQKLTMEWKNAALDKEIIAPEGSNRDNHRQDQAVLSCLYYQHLEDWQIAQGSKTTISPNPDLQYGITVQNDLDKGGSGFAVMALLPIIMIMIWCSILLSRYVYRAF